MTYPTITSTTKNFAAGGGSHSIPVPSGTAGELLTLFVGHNAGTVTGSVSGTWTEVYDNSRFYVAKKITTAASEGNVTVTWSGGSPPIAYIVLRSNAQDVEVTQTTVTSVDPPSLTASWGAGDHKWIAGIHANSDNFTITGTPTNYSTFVEESGTSGGGTDQRMVLYSYNYNATDTQDPSPAFTFTGTASSRRGITAVLRTPASTNPTIDSTTKLEASQSFTITGSTFGASQGTNGRVLISPTDNASDVGAVTQTVSTWSDTSLVINSATLTSMDPTETVYVFVRNDSSNQNTSGFAVQIADFVLRVGSGVLTDTLKDIDTGSDIASENCARMIVMSGAAGSEVIEASYTNSSVTSGVMEYADSSIFNLTTAGDEYLVAVQGNLSTRQWLLPGFVVDRNDD